MSISLRGDSTSLSAGLQWLYCDPNTYLSLVLITLLYILFWCHAASSNLIPSLGLRGLNDSWKVSKYFVFSIFPLFCHFTFVVEPFGTLIIIRPTWLFSYLLMYFWAMIAKENICQIEGLLNWLLVNRCTTSDWLFCFFFFFSERPWLVDSYDQWLERLKVSLFLYFFFSKLLV